MKKIILIFIFLVSNKFSHAHESFEHRCFKDEKGTCEYHVSVYQVIANPSFFHNKKILILGYLYKQTAPYNSLVIFPTKQEAESEVPIFSNGIAINASEEGFNKIGIRKRSFSGTFKASKKPFPYYLGFLDID